MSIFALEINGSMVTMYPNTKVKWIFKSPLFATSIEPPSRTFNIQIPVNGNDQILEFANVINVRTRLYLAEGRAYINGKFWKNCKVYIDASSHEQFTIRAVIDRGYFADLGKSRLRDFNYNNPTKYRFFEDSVAYREYTLAFLSGVPSSGVATALIWTLENPENKDISHQYVIPYTPAETMATFLARTAATINADYTKHGIRVDVKPSDILRFVNTWGNGQYPDVAWVAADIEYYSYFVDPVNSSNYFANTPFQQTNHANDVVANPSNYDYIFFPTKVPAFAQTGSGFDFTGVVNDWSPVAVSPYGVGFRGMQALGTAHKNGFSPAAYLYNVLSMIHAELNIRVIDRFFDEELKTLVIYSPVLTDYNWNSESWFSPSFKFADILPDVTYGELITGLAGAFGFIPDFDSVKNQITFTCRKDVFASGEYDDWTDLVQKNLTLDRVITALKLKYSWPEDELLTKERLIVQGERIYNYKGQVTSTPSASVSSNKDLVLLKASNHYYSFSSTFGGGNWNYVAEQLEDSIDKPNQNEIQLGFSPLFSGIFSSNYKIDSPTKINNWLLPYTNVSPQFVTIQKDKWPVRFLFYRGMQPGKYQAGTDPAVLTDMEYPLAHYHNYNYLGEKIGNYSLALHGEDGVIEKWQKDWIEFVEQGEPIKMGFDLSEVELRNLNLLKKKRINNQDFLIDELEVTMGDVIELSTAKCYQIRKKYEQ